MKQYHASQCIIRYLRFCGLQPDEYISVDCLTDLLIHNGMSIKELRSGLLLALRNSWLQTIDDYIGLTEQGYLRYHPANDNKRIWLTT